MFREKLHKDLDGISPDEELLTKVTKMMQEEAAKPRQPKHIAVMRYAGMAAAVCMIAVGSLALYGGGAPAVENSVETADYAAEETQAAVQEAALEDGATEMYSPSVNVQSGDGEEPVAFSVDEAAAEVASEEAIGAAEQSAEEKSVIILPEYKNKGIYENTVMNAVTRGPAASYDEIMNGRYDEIDSLYRIRITGIIDSSEAARLSGYNVDTDEFDGFYNAVIEYDYMSQADKNEEIILNISGDGKFGMSDGCPPYTEGDVIAVVLQENTESEDFRRRFSYAFHYDIYEIGGIYYGAVRSQNVPEAEMGLTDYFGGEIVKYETTTPDNPAVYYGLYEIEGIADNLRELFR